MSSASTPQLKSGSPYGQILSAEDFDTHPGIKIGHQGLFFDRLEPPAPVGGEVSIGAATQLQPGIFGLYQVRNRVLLPRYGRWAQKDPNASGMLHATLWHDGQAPMPELAAGSLQGVTTDGSNLFTFVGGSPFNATDGTGRVMLPTRVPNGELPDGAASHVGNVVIWMGNLAGAVTAAAMMGDPLHNNVALETTILEQTQRNLAALLAGPAGDSATHLVKRGIMRAGIGVSSGAGKSIGVGVQSAVAVAGGITFDAVVQMAASAALYVLDTRFGVQPTLNAVSKLAYIGLGAAVYAGIVEYQANAAIYGTGP